LNKVMLFYKDIGSLGTQSNYCCALKKNDNGFHS
jgi:hypothetical protein